MSEALSSLAAAVVALVGLGWLALGMDMHWRQVHDGTPRRLSTPMRLRALGGGALLVSLAMCLLVDPPAMAALVWTMMMSAASITVAMTLTWRARWLRLLTPWQTSPRP